MPNRQRVKTRARAEAIKKIKEAGMPYEKSEYIAFAQGFNVGWKIRGKKIFKEEE